MKTRTTPVAFALAGSLFFLANTTAATAHGKKPFPALEDLSTFYVGGTIEFSDCNSSDCNSPTPRRIPGNISVNAAYVERPPLRKRRSSIPLSLCTVAATTVRFS
jgi:hypothetical protein